jgi:hypothetical protein
MDSSSLLALDQSFFCFSSSKRSFYNNNNIKNTRIRRIQDFIFGYEKEIK